MGAFMIVVITAVLLIINVAEHAPAFFSNASFCQYDESNCYSDVDEFDYYTEYDQSNDYDQYEYSQISE
ncbi:3416_t:CDS:2 [Gigaspora rosea]|nr:3416_t:CDS:2 [Gigaspora rosea]